MNPPSALSPNQKPAQFCTMKLSGNVWRKVCWKEKKLYSLIPFCRAPHSFKFSLPLFLVSDIYFTVPLFYLALKSSCRSRKSPVSSFERYLLKLEIHRFVLLFKFSPFLIMKYLKTFIIEMGPYPMYIYYFI